MRVKHTYILSIYLIFIAYIDMDILEILVSITVHEYGIWLQLLDE
jgi:hypothetical protein